MLTLAAVVTALVGWTTLEKLHAWAECPADEHTASRIASDARSGFYHYTPAALPGIVLMPSAVGQVRVSPGCTATTLS